MTNVWKVRWLDGYQYVNATVLDAEFLAGLDNYDGRSVLGAWNPPVISLLQPQRGPRRAEFGRSDAPLCFPTIMLFSSRVVEVLSDLLRAHGEFLDTRSIERHDVFVFFNPTTQVDALDRERTTFRKFGRHARIIGIEKYVFRPGPDLDLPIFHLVGDRNNELYFGDVFVEAWKHHRFRGLNFDKVWSDEDQVEST